MAIELNRITDRQMLVIQNGLNTYLYIQSHWQDDDDDFRKVFTDYYLKAQGAMRKPENQTPYFRKLQECTPDKDLVELVAELYNELAIHKYEFSFATKLLHTVNNESPIFDSTVKNYLSQTEQVLFYGSGTRRGRPIDRIRHDWKQMVTWYEQFLQSPRAHEWINWFDGHFPDARQISNVKKVDFIIFACAKN